MFTVKQLSKVAGVTPRTLHHYDAIGLLKPSRVGENGYRYYGEESLLRLQQILFYRELGIPLEDIKKIMGRRDFDVMGALQKHKEALKKQMARLNRLINTVDNTILYLKGNKEMSNKQLFEAFSDEQQAEYEKEIMQKYDPATVKASIKKWKEYTAAEKQRIGEEGNAVYQDILGAMPKGAAETQFKVIKRYPESALVEARPMTGRTHQIRVHAYVLGHPLVEDVLYGARDRYGLPRPMLHARSLSFIHPATNERVKFSAPHPADFEEAIKQIGAVY